jgi:hypothetical protein
MVKPEENFWVPEDKTALIFESGPVFFEYRCRYVLVKGDGTLVGGNREALMRVIGLFKVSLKMVQHECFI